MQNVFDEFSVRINHAYAMPFAHVADCHIFEERRFASACLSDEVHMLAAVILLYAELHAAIV